ncbi:MAG: cytochrome d ubiquinol oxidase subunit II [Candidatus Binatia bacterium]
MTLDQQTLALVWFAILGLLLSGYAILDGFDLGVGILQPFLPRDEPQRRLAINTIGPLWDGNEVWLVTFGGAMFAAFPNAYASVFSGFYTPFMALLFALVLRAVSMEFRGKAAHATWRRLWDGCFFAGSFLASLLFGVAVGNVLRGIPLDARGDFTGSLADLLNPYALLVGLLVVALFAMHGAIYLHLRTEGDLQRRAEGWMWRTFGLFLLLFMLTTMVTLVVVPRAAAHFENNPMLWLVPVVNVFAIANIPRALYHRSPAQAFASSSITILALVVLLGAALFPNLLHSLPEPENSLTIFNAASSPRTLKIMLLVAAIGMPLVLAYTGTIYWTFRGKVKLDEHSY